MQQDLKSSLATKNPSKVADIKNKMIKSASNLRT